MTANSITGLELSAGSRSIATALPEALLVLYCSLLSVSRLGGHAVLLDQFPWFYKTYLQLLIKMKVGSVLFENPRGKC